MQSKLFAAVAALAVAISGAAVTGNAYAGSEQYQNGPARPIYSSTATRDTGSEAYPTFDGPAVVVQSNVATNQTDSAAYPIFDGQAALSGEAPAALAAAPKARGLQASDLAARNLRPAEFHPSTRPGSTVTR